MHLAENANLEPLISGSKFSKNKDRECPCNDKELATIEVLQIPPKETLVGFGFLSRLTLQCVCMATDGDFGMSVTSKAVTDVHCCKCIIKCCRICWCYKKEYNKLAGGGGVQNFLHATL